MCPANPDGSGAFSRSAGAGDFVLSTRGDGLLSTAQAARLVGVAASTMRSWASRGHLSPRGLDERGRPLYHEDDVRAAEALVRANGLRASGIDPRQLRHAGHAA